MIALMRTRHLATGVSVVSFFTLPSLNPLPPTVLCIPTFFPSVVPPISIKLFLEQNMHHVPVLQYSLLL